MIVVGDFLEKGGIWVLRCSWDLVLRVFECSVLGLLGVIEGFLVVMWFDWMYV